MEADCIDVVEAAVLQSAVSLSLSLSLSDWAGGRRDWFWQLLQWGGHEYFNEQDFEETGKKETGNNMDVNQFQKRLLKTYVH